MGRVTRLPAVCPHTFMWEWAGGGVGGCWAPLDLIGGSLGGECRSPACSPPPAPCRHPPPRQSSRSHVAAPRRFPASPPAPSALLALAPRPGRPAPTRTTPPPRPCPARLPSSRRLPGAVLAAPGPGRPAGGAALPPGSGAAPRLPGPGGEGWGRPRLPSRRGFSGGRGGQVRAPRGQETSSPALPPERAARSRR